MEGYAVVRRLATTRTGQVLLCTDRQTGTPVVVKRVKVPFAARHASTVVSTERQIHRHMMKADNDNAVTTHPHILALYDDFVQHGYEHLVLEYCANGELFDVVEQLPNGRVEPTVAKSYFSQICDALQFMHGRGIAHCDLSLENVLVDANGTLKVSDFGLSMETDQRRDHAVGKSFYMAPEMHSGESYDPVLADVWSIGVMLFIMLTGSPPVDSSEVSDPVMQFVHEKGWRSLVHEWDFDDVVSEDALDLMENILQVDPLKRWTLAQVVAHPFLQSSSMPPVTPSDESLLIHKLHNSLTIVEQSQVPAGIEFHL
ncbi:hypothetical protein DYB37_006506 [Aphanomyces astaci]|uniref:Protein kinase domain-containing protein n=2 Tax=Aphanomyces astaci TaxID=112090 RepID=A0A397D6H6_APHAT|nr:hypothetical protein DYB36_000376 [Aphanomyces astaci]RHY23430.1 hypothetical protein DYB25_009516 [Aphanomyces astaci]RHY56051.1 hypothetical protein DYB30_002936 [Aphanomyces astaci]RHY80463.1 hypothetical protein DYB35_005059 [Aphanomyces astaci]RHZ27000.1 hypothetical protein DYB37_006506 [Aphanomyces astaci]